MENNKANISAEPQNVGTLNMYKTGFGGGRIEWIDIAKGIGIILVVLGHITPRGSFINDFIYVFHMPLFFICCGLCFKGNTSFRDLLKKRLRQLMLPFIFFFMMTAPICIYIAKDYALNRILNDAPYALWFLPVLFISELFFWEICHYLKNKKYMLLAICILFLAGYVLYKYKIGIPYSLSAVFHATAFIGIGFYVKNMNYRYKLLTAITLFVLLSASVLFVLPKESFNLIHNKLGPEYYGFLFSLLGAFMVIALSQKIKSNRFLSFFGQNSLGIMCIHFPLLSIVTEFVKPVIVNHIIYKCIELTIVLFGALLISILFEKYFPFVMGKIKK